MPCWSISRCEKAHFMIDSLFLQKILLCPVCSSPLRRGDVKGDIMCCAPHAHHYDLSRSGYLNLNIRGGQGDLKAAVESRHAFFEDDPYRSVRQAMSAALSHIRLPDGVILDAGCGEGYYTNFVAALTPDRSVLGMDLSKYAIDTAAKEAARKALDNTTYIVCSISDMPLEDDSCALILNVFAPCFEQEFFRVLRRDGVFMMVSAGPDHLMGLKKVLYEETYSNSERADTPKGMREIDNIPVHDVITVRGEKIMDLFSMTPYFWKTNPESIRRLSDMDTLETEIDFCIRLFRKE